MKLETPEQAKALCVEAHKGQYRRPVAVVTDLWDCYKTVTASIMPNGDKIIYVIGNRFDVCRPYSSHPIAIADMMNTPYRKMLAYLHDVIEDCDYKLVRGLDGEGYLNYYIAHVEHPIRYEISWNLFRDLDLLTKDPDLTYEQNIRRIKDSGRADAIAVKIADTCDNLSTATDKQKEKYLTIPLPILLEY